MTRGIVWFTQVGEAGREGKWRPPPGTQAREIQFAHQ